VTALACVDARLVALTTARLQLVAMHDRIENERRWLGPLRQVSRGDARQGLDRYDGCLLHLDAVLMSVIAGNGWDQPDARQAAVPRLRAAVLELLANTPEAGR
jgi:hypothetical protein